jgi:DNA-binding winged helix-turn-helix (wHTH) protein
VSAFRRPQVLKKLERISKLTLRFGEFVLDADARQLQRDGKNVRLSPKAFDLLRTLLARRPDVIAKGDLLAAIWPDTYVIEANLNVAIGEIRRALGDDPHAPRFIRTVHAVGYAFCAQAFEIREDSAAESAQPRPRCWLSRKNRTFALAEGENIIGRDPRSTVWLDDDSVSRRHARITVADASARLEDLDSTNGTHLGNLRVTSPTTVADGDVVRVGSLRLTFHTWSDKSARTRRLRDRSESNPKTQTSNPKSQT